MASSGLFHGFSNFLALQPKGRKMDILDPLFQVLASSIRLAVPLICACLAGLWSERAGVVDIGLEGKMLAAAFAAAAAALFTGNAFLGLLAGMSASILFALVHGYASISQRGNQIVSGVAINMLAAGLAAVLGNAWYSQGGRTPPVEQAARFLPINLPGADTLGAIPVFGGIYKQLLSGHTLLAWLAFIAVPVTWWVLQKTRFGLRLRAVGENPAAVDTAGALCGLGGAYLSIAQGAGYLNNMTAGKGFIALAALIFAKWQPAPALAACLLFGFLDAMAIRIEGVPLPLIGQVPVQAIQALPYILTVVLLAGFIGKAIPPKAAGVPYVKER
jgi:general nucleoside transport system permease protein